MLPGLPGAADAHMLSSLFAGQGEAGITVCTWSCGAIQKALQAQRPELAALGEPPFPPPLSPGVNSGCLVVAHWHLFVLSFLGV